MYLYLTTTGRVTGQPREIEIWFTEHDGHFYLVAERESANWVRNLQSRPQVKVQVGDAEFNAIAGPRPPASITLAIVNPSGILCRNTAKKSIQPSQCDSTNPDPIATPSKKVCVANPSRTE